MGRLAISTQPAFTTHIADTREESHKEDANMDAVIRVYTDGSGYKDQAGAAAVLVRTDGVHECRRVLRYHLGPLSEHTVYEAEAVGIILGAHLLLTEDPELASRDSSISLDNQAVIRAAEYIQRAQPGHYLLDHFRTLTDHLWQIRGAGYSLEMHWISGHDDAELNEFVDGQAKLAAEGHSSPMDDLPAFLHLPLRASLSATRQEYTRQLHERWQRDWMCSPRYQRHKHWAPDAATKSHMKTIESLSRRDSAVLFQLRTGHAPLNKHLHRMRCSESPTCDACGEADETVPHFIYECQARLTERRALRKAAGKNWRNRAYLLSDTTGVKALMGYVRDTGRMRWSRREEDDTQEGNFEDGERKEEEEVEDEEEGEDEEGARRAKETEEVDTTIEGLLKWFERLPRGEERGERDSA